MKRVFILEDYESILRGWCRFWEFDGYDIEVVAALTLEEANTIIDQGFNYDLGIIDGHIGERAPYNSGPVIRRIRKISPTPLLATSSEAITRRQMLDDGCKYAVDKMVHMAVVNTVVELLGLKPAQPLPT